MSLPDLPVDPGTLAFRPVPRTGVIYVNAEAAVRGYRRGHPDWANLGQGQPEAGLLPGAPPRIDQLALHPTDHEYAPVAGMRELREAVATLYNHLYRRGMPSQYRVENVAIRMLQRVREMGMTVNREPDGTFYVFVSLEGLPEPLSDGMQLFREALEHGVITVPGVFFDVNPGGRRAHHVSRFRQHLRLSFGPEMAEVERGLDRLAGMIGGA